MAGLLDFLLNGQGGGVLGGPGSANAGAGDPSQVPQIDPAALQAYAQAQQQPQQVAQAQYAQQPQMPQYMQMDPRLNPGSVGFGARFMMGYNPQLGAALLQQRAQGAAIAAMMAPKSQGGMGLSYPQAAIAVQNPKVQEWISGIPINNGIAESPNGAKIPVISTPGNVGQYAMPQDPTMRSTMINAPVKLGQTTTKVGQLETSGPSIYQGGQNINLAPQMPGTSGTPAQPQTGSVSGLGGAASLPGSSGWQGAINLNNKLAQGQAAAEAAGKVQGTNAANLPNTTAILDQTIKNIDEVAKDPNLTYAVGAIAGRIPPVTGHQADLVNRISQLQSQTMLQGFQQLRGAGRITQAEMFKAGDALARLNRVSSLDGFRTALKDLRDVAVAARTRAGPLAGTAPTPPEQTSPQVGGFTQDQLRAEAIRRGLIKP